MTSWDVQVLRLQLCHYAAELRGQSLFVDREPCL